MDIKNSYGYEHYLIYLNEKLSTDIINDNQYKLLKMSYHNYAKFINRLEREIDFKINMENKHKEYLRLERIKKILDGDNIN